MALLVVPKLPLHGTMQVACTYQGPSVWRKTRSQHHWRKAAFEQEDMIASLRGGRSHSDEPFEGAKEATVVDCRIHACRECFGWREVPADKN